MPYTGREATQCAARLARLPGRRRELLALLALLGRPAPPALLTRASGRTLREVLDCLDRLARAGLAQPGQDGWDLTYPLAGQVATGTLGPAGQARVHLLLAQALERGDGDAAEIAAHLAAGGDRPGAATAYAAAAALRLQQALRR